MRCLYDPTRHEALSGLDWDPSRAREAIVAICRDAEAAFDVRRLWPPHPRDVEPGGPEDGIFRGLYLGAAGMVHALRRLGYRLQYHLRQNHLHDHLCGLRHLRVRQREHS